MSFTVNIIFEFLYVQEEYHATSYELSADGLFLLIGYDLQAVCTMAMNAVIARSWRLPPQCVSNRAPLLSVHRDFDIQLSPDSLSTTSVPGACSRCIAWPRHVNHRSSRLGAHHDHLLFQFVTYAQRLNEYVQWAQSSSKFEYKYHKHGRRLTG